MLHVIHGLFPVSLSLIYSTMYLSSSTLFASDQMSYIVVNTCTCTNVGVTAFCYIIQYCQYLLSFLAT